MMLPPPGLSWGDSDGAGGDAKAFSGGVWPGAFASPEDVMKFGGAYGTAVLGSGGFGAAVGPIDHGRSMGENEESTEATEDEQHSSASSA